MTPLQLVDFLCETPIHHALSWPIHHALSCHHDSVRVGWVSGCVVDMHAQPMATYALERGCDSSLCSMLAWTAPSAWAATGCSSAT